MTIVSAVRPCLCELMRDRAFPAAVFGPVLRFAFAQLQERGLRRVGLGVDVDNETGAVGLYERAGMRVVRRFDNWTRTP